MQKIKVGSDFSGVGAFDQALKRLGVNYETVFACDMDKYARDTFINNYGEPKYYPMNVYDREIPSESLDIFMTSPPCQAFSLAGKRLGKYDKRGILFFNSHEFIQVNKPRFFIFENVKGLLSDDGGRTFQEWVNMLGGKSVNGLPILFPVDEAVPYHLYWQVLNAKKHGVPQNRERVFLIGIRDDLDNKFQFPKEEHLTKRLKDVLDNNVDDKYFLSENTIDKLIAYDQKQKENGNGFGAKFHDENGTMSALKVGGGGCDDLVKIKSGTSKVFKESRESDSLFVADYRADEGLIIRKDDISPCMTSSMQDYAEWNPKAGTLNPPLVGYNDKRLNETIAKNELHDGKPMMLDTYNQSVHEECPTLKARHAQNNDRRLWDGFKIRRLTPRECFRLMDFPDTFTWNVSDSQAYKQAGNSIVVNVLYKILKQLPI
jgi:DNA (cytosine-5)-methyltransferase 1